MKNKELYIRIICVLIGLIVGVSATIGCWYYKEVYQFGLQPVNKSEVKEFNVQELWDKTSSYYENDLNIFLNNYYTIYNAYSLYDFLEKTLKPYYDEYGYDVVLASGLESNNKMANIYCIEKCCDIIGDERINAKSILKLLEKLLIDTEIKTDYEEEQKYIDLAKDRLALAISLFSQEYDDENIIKSKNEKRYAWVSNMFYGNTKIRLLDNGLYYTLSEDFEYIPDEFDFIDDNILQLKNTPDNGGNIKIICFSERITVFDIQDVIYSYMEQHKESPEEEHGYPSNIKDITYNDTLISGTCEVYQYRSDDGEKYSFVIDAKQSEIVNLEKIN